MITCKQNKLTFVKLLFCIFSLSVAAAEQTFADEVEKTPLNKLIGTEELAFSGFVDTAFSYDFNKFDPRNRSYLTQPTRDREMQLNLAFLDVKLSTENYRGRLAFQGGSSVDVNYSAEPEKAWRTIQEATLGTKLAEGLWLDAGIYFSHIGAESFISRDNWSYTRLLASDFSPYYQSGAKLSYEFSESLSAQLHYMNGWQNVTDFSGRNAVGTQVAYKFENGATLTHNTFLGNEPEGTRFFNDFVAKAPPIGNLELAALFDVGDQQRSAGGHDQWYTWAILSRYSLGDSVKLSARAEQYLDNNNVLVSTRDGSPFKTLGFSAGVDVELLKSLWWRSEYRSFIAEASVFPSHTDGSKATDHFVVTSLSYSF